jgi:uncharacterized protein YbbC (DUF1343 family)
MIEYAKNYSVGRGTDSPFELVGADWIRGAELSKFLNSRMIPGVRSYPARFTPSSSNFSGVPLEGVHFFITDRNSLNSARLGLEIAFALEKLYPGKIDYEGNRRLIGSRKAIAAMKSAQDPRTTMEEMEEDVRAFVARRAKYLLYK